MRKRKFPPNPLPCGCAAMGEMDFENAVDDGHCLHVGNKNVHVVHCAKHANTDAALAAANERIAELEKDVTTFRERCIGYEIRLGLYKVVDNRAAPETGGEK